MKLHFIKIINFSIILLITSLFFKKTALAQNNLGHHTDNYAGVHALNFNPAEIVDSRFRFHMNIVSVSNTFSNNYLGIRREALFSERDIAFNDDQFVDNYLVERLNGRDKAVYQNFEIGILPSMMFTFGKKRQQAIGINFRTRMNFNLNGVNEGTARQSLAELELIDLQNVGIQNDNFSLQSALWNEYGLTYGSEVLNTGKHYLKASRTLKLTQGLASTYFYSDNLDITFPSDTSVSVTDSDIDFGYSEVFSSSVDGANNFFGNSKFGFGADVGLVYEWRPNIDEYKYEMNGDPDYLDPRKNKYKLKIGFSIMDMGFTSYNRANGFDANYYADRQDIWIEETFGDAFSDFENTGLQGFGDTLASIFVEGESENDFYRMTLPTRIHAYVDYNIWKGFYANVTAAIAPGFVRNPEKTRGISEFSVTPRFEHKWIGFYLPFSVNSHGNPHLGAGLRVGPLAVGTYDFLAFAGKSTIYDANFYASLSVPITRKLRDKDKDHVSNKKDQCRKEPGTWASMGCPDVDECQENPDLCNDNDGDGIVNAKDDCPDVAGLEAFNGCPDTDEDGIPDAEDECPTEAGLEVFNGCPDTDGDSIQNQLDDCPLVAGPLENKGCPWPDTDKDGVPDKDDKCPNTPGPVENQGCPIIKEEVKEIIKVAFDNLEFQSGKAVIKKSSLPSLEKLADILKENPTYKIRIDGHTDNTGGYDLNMKLSLERANAVKQFLMEEGILPLRLITNGYGPDQPIGDNNTAAGRQLNRRVEMEIIFD
jgi:outer membrane protein OmpA-like peptidoglycan-associated protein